MTLKAFTILSILATVCFAAILFLQISERGYYRAEPSVWSASP